MRNHRFLTPDKCVGDYGESAFCKYGNVGVMNYGWHQATVGSERDRVYKWAEEQFKSADVDYLFCNFHAGGGSLRSLCHKYGAITVNGHSHKYQRSKLLSKYPDTVSSLDEPTNIRVGCGQSLHIIAGMSGHAANLGVDTNPSLRYKFTKADVPSSYAELPVGALICDSGDWGSAQMECKYHVAEMGVKDTFYVPKGNRASKCAPGSNPVVVPTRPPTYPPAVAPHPQPVASPVPAPVPTPVANPSPVPSPIATPVASPVTPPSTGGGGGETELVTIEVSLEEDAERGESGFMYDWSPTLELSYDPASEDGGAPQGQQLIALRFIMPTSIEQGTKIHSAQIEFEAATTSSQGDPKMRIKANDVDDAPGFGDEELDTRARTHYSSYWELGDWVAGKKYQTPTGLKFVLQEVIDRPGYKAGNAVMFFIHRDESDPSLHTRTAVAETAKLLVTIEGTSSPNTSSSSSSQPLSMTAMIAMGAAVGAVVLAVVVTLRKRSAGAQQSNNLKGGRRQHKVATAAYY